MIILPAVILLAAAASAQTVVVIGPPCGQGAAGPDAFRTIRGLTVAADGAGNVFVAEIGKTIVRRLSTSGALTVFAGNGNLGFGGDGGPAASATLGYITSIAADTAGNLFIAETGSPRIRKVTPAGVITTVAGNGTLGITGDGGPATAAPLCPAIALAVDLSGNLFLASGTGTGADSLLGGDYRIRKVASNGIITTIAGTGLVPRLGLGNTGGAPAGDGGMATSGTLWPTQIAAGDSSGNVFMVDAPPARIRKIVPSGTITTIAGTDNTGPVATGDGGPATQAFLAASIMGLAVDRAGSVYILSAGRDVRVRKIDASGVIRTVAGDGTAGYQGDGGPATAAKLSILVGRGGGSRIAVDGAGNLFIAETQRGTDGRETNRVRKVTPQGIISTIITFP
jgi:hypothetical protein